MQRTEEIRTDEDMQRLKALMDSNDPIFYDRDWWILVKVNVTKIEREIRGIATYEMVTRLEKRIPGTDY